MNLENLLYFFFSSITLTAAIFVIYSTNTVYSAFFLILVFTSTTALLLLSEIEFLSLMLIIIYVGAITVLFIFVIMMLDIKVLIHKNNDNNFGYIPIVCLIGFILFIETYLMFSKTFTTYFHFLDSSAFFERVFSKTIVNHLDTISNIETLGQVLYTYYSFFFLIAGIILLIALIGAITLTKKNKKKERFISKNIYKQLSRNASNAVFAINSHKNKGY